MGKLSKVLEAIDAAKKRKLEAYHGTPHDVDKFSMDKIGTGEGSQYYGKGLYFAEQKQIAEGYRYSKTPQIGDRTITVDGKAASNAKAAEIAKWAQDYKMTNNEIKQRIYDMGILDENGDEFKKVKKYMEKSLDNSTRTRGHLYKVELDIDPDLDMIDLQKQYNDQPKKIQKILDEIDPEAKNKKYDIYYNPIKDLVNNDEGLEKLKNIGIKGARHHDNLAGNMEKPTSVFVVFDDSLISIAEKNGIPFEQVTNLAKQKGVTNQQALSMLVGGSTGIALMGGSERAEAAVFGKSVKFINDALENNKQFLYHSGDASIAEDVAKYGLEPQHGEWIQEVMAGAVDNPDEFLEGVPPAVWFDKAPQWVKIKAARSAGKSPNDMTEEDIRDHGMLAIVDPEGEWHSPEDFYKIPKEGMMEGEYTKVENLLGEKMPIYETPLYKSSDFGGAGRVTEGLEPHDIVTTEAVEPTTVLTGNDLIDFLKKNYGASPENRNYIQEIERGNIDPKLLAGTAGVSTTAAVAAPLLMQQEQQQANPDNANRFIQKRKQRPSSLVSRMQYYGEPAATIATSVAGGLFGDAVGGLAGMASAPFVGHERASEIVQGIQDYIPSYMPQSEAGMQGMEAFGGVVDKGGQIYQDAVDYYGIDPAANFNQTAEDLHKRGYNLPAAVLKGLPNIL